jgi:hypothetical protein
VLTRINREGVYNRERWEVLDADAAARTLTLRRIGGDERTVTLTAKYLNRHRENDHGPAIEHSYAMTKFSAQGKTFDTAFPLLDAGASSEQELVALSRGRVIERVYVVASSELVDPELGPGRREVSDELHDVRSAIEREGNDFTAAVLGLRKKLETHTPRVLADPRAARAAPARAADPVLSRRDRLDREIRDAELWVGALGQERDAIEAMKDPPTDELARMRRGEAAQAERLRRCLRERDALPESTTAAEPKPLDSAARLEAALVDRRIAQLARWEVEAARLEPSKVMYDALGPFPANDPDKALAWGEGAHALTIYRRRHGISDDHNPFGMQPRGAAARAERARAQQRLQEVQRKLGRTTERSAQRAFSGSLSIT